MTNFEKHIIKGINVGNVTQVTSSCPWLPNHTFSETFTYDASDQLVSASETQNQSYQLEVTYGNWGRIDDYSLLHTELWSGTTTHDHRSFAYPNDPYNPQQAQTLFAPEMHNGTSDVTYSFGINGSLRKREEHSPNPCTEYYLFNSAANMKAYSNNGLDFAYYGYNASNTQGFLYAPFGEITTEYAPLWQNGTIPKYSFNAKELDEETGMYYYEARYYKPPVFTSRDPMFEKYFWMTPYAYCANNPVKYVDPSGEENVIYLVNLQGGNQVIDPQRLIADVNKHFATLGLETRMMMAPDGRHFDPRFIDKTDSYVVLGSVNDVKNFVKQMDPRAYNDDIQYLEGGGSNPECSANRKGCKKQAIAIDAHGLNCSAVNMNVDLAELACLTVLHGAGHNANLNHSDEVYPSPRNGQNIDNARIMCSGDYYKRHSNEISNIQAVNNSVYINTIK